MLSATMPFRRVRLPMIMRQSARAAMPCRSLLETGIGRPGVHEIHAAAGDGAAAAGFALAVAALLLKRKPAMLWVRHDLLQAENGGVYPPGLAAFGIPPAAVTLVRVKDVLGVLQAGLEAARCSALAVILVDFWGSARAYDLTASRRLALAAKASGVTLFLLRHAASAMPSAAETRWSVKGLPSRPLAALAPGPPAFAATLLRHRGGMAGQVWRVEWNRDTGYFEDIAGQGAALSGGLAAIPARRAPALREAG